MLAEPLSISKSFNNATCLQISDYTCVLVANDGLCRQLTRKVGINAEALPVSASKRCPAQWTSVGSQRHVDWRRK